MKTRVFVVKDKETNLFYTEDGFTELSAENAKRMTITEACDFCDFLDSVDLADPDSEKHLVMHIREALNGSK